MTKLELYDCTLREGEQAAGASFNLADRVELFSTLDNLGFDFIELGWPLASEDIFNSFELCRKVRKKAKIVAFGSTSINSNLFEDRNLNSILESGADYACIFGKTHLEHVIKQLKLTGEDNLKRITESVKFLKTKIPVFYDAEHYFDGFKQNSDYALKTLESAFAGGAERLILCDTNGGVLPNEAERIIRLTYEFLSNKNIDAGLGIHFHNDCGLALANTLASFPYISQVQGTINGIGERVGNLNFSEFIPVCMKKLGKNLDIHLKDIKQVNEKAYRLAGIDIPESRAFVGDSAFAHKGGVHIDATTKGASYEHEIPEEFGNKRIIILNTLGGAAGVINAASRFGYNLDKKNPETSDKIKRLFVELRELEQQGYRIGAFEAEQYLLVEKYFGNLNEFFNLDWRRFDSEKRGDNEKSTFFGDYRINGDIIRDSITINGGPIDAAYKSMKRVLSKKYPKIKSINLVDFHVGIARSSSEESTVRTVASFEDGCKFKTVGVDANILESGAEALTKGFRYYLNKIYKLEKG